MQIGMGLNLRIKRIIFTSLMRMNSEGKVMQIADTEIRQIGGRAGRFMENGLIACIKHRDLMHVKFALKDVNMNYDKKMMQKNQIVDEESSSDDEVSENKDHQTVSHQNILHRKYEFIFLS